MSGKYSHRIILQHSEIVSTCLFTNFVHLEILYGNLEILYLYIMSIV